MLAKDVFLEITRRIDPRTKATAEITAATLGTVDGSQFPHVRLLQIYNEARRVLVSAAINAFGRYNAAALVPGVIYPDTITFNSGAAPKPTNYVDFLSVAALSISGVTAGMPIIVLPAALMEIVRGGRIPWYVESVTKLFLFDIGGGFSHVSALIPNSSTATLTYFKVTPLVNADILNAATTVEVFDERRIHDLIEIAIAIASEMGSQKVNALAEKLLGGKG